MRLRCAMLHAVRMSAPRHGSHCEKYQQRKQRKQRQRITISGRKMHHCCQCLGRLCEKIQHGIDRVYQRTSRASQHLGQFDAGATSVKHIVIKTLHGRRNCKAGGTISAEADPAPSEETHHDKTKIDRRGSIRGRSLPLHGGPKAAETAPENRRN
jgi:hypothetical protein